MLRQSRNASREPFRVSGAARAPTRATLASKLQQAHAFHQPPKEVYLAAYNGDRDVWMPLLCSSAHRHGAHHLCQADAGIVD
jgi:hypothetical protein